MKRNITKKIIVIIAIAILLFNISSNCFALELSAASLKTIGTADQHLKYFREDRGYSTYVVCSIVGYYNQYGAFLPAYCMNKDLPGAETLEYTVDIHSLIDNEAVWRVVKNGFPYKSAAEMGLNNDFDAYAVTKFAVYCVLGQSNLSYYSAEPNDAIGQQMLNVLYDLVNIGINGTETRSDGTMSVKKVDGFLDANGYYFQDYKISSTVNMSEIIVGFENLPEGSYIADIYNNAKTTFSNGDIVRILIPTNKLNSNINGKINIAGKCQTYPVFYGEAPAGLQDYVVTFDSYGDEYITTDLKINTNTGSLKVVKIDDETEVSIQGVSFILESEDGSYKQEEISDNNGEILFTNLYQGNYILIETATNENYNFDETVENKIVVEYNKESKITIGNVVKKGKIKIIKTDYETGESLEGVKFNILDADTEEVIQTLITNKNGEAESDHLRVDKSYLLQEVETLENYILNDEPFYFTVTEDEIFELEIENKKQPEPEEPEPEQPLEPETPEVEEPEPEQPLKSKTPKVEKPQEEPVIEFELEVIEEVKILPKTGF